MPKIVDHERRRAEIVGAFLTVVAREGLAGAGSRAIAAELGVGAGALWHYFDSLDAVVSAACQRVLEEVDTRIAAAAQDRRGLAALDATLREILPVSGQARDEAEVMIGFWGRLAVSRRPGPAATEALARWGDVVRRQLTEAVEDGELRPGVPVAALADVLLSVAIGQQVHAVLAAPATDPEGALTLVEHCLSPWRQLQEATAQGLSRH
ncbi:TetR family transcriptional regulator [Paractinoplanes abujensis]|uniref:AcrR family transcriptional regulator n=1 Tax=Paractinoplanes abujensis TaxID=882441 RepID=A0A7W7CPC2_9ACTN|nr:TetR/AcrR family transcriptional regulator [Actinoplanes abujensis]MBB4691939.1 AcrR family transcriptional regulator [Actinoplanes abujensis]GID16642.1 TetR family transcriptional regulator [Actinoplanes abujensis]